MSSFSRDSAHTLALSTFNRVVGIAAGIVLARYLGPEGKGWIAYAAIGLELFVTVINGVAQAATYQYGQRKLPAGAVYGAMLRIVAAVSVPGAIVLAVVAAAVPSQRPLLAVAFALPFALYAQATTGILLAARRVAWTNVQGAIATSGFNALAIAAAVLFHAGATMVLGVWVLTYVAAALYAWWGIRPLVRGAGRSTAAVVREQAGFAIKAGSAQVAGYLNMRIDVVLVSILLGARALGIYTLAIGVAEMLWLLTQPLCWAAFARVAAAETAEAAAFTAKLTRHIVALIVPVAALAALAAPALVGRIYGSAFDQAGSTILWLLPGMAVYSIEIPLGYFLMVKLGRPGLIVAIQMSAVVICAALTVLTVRRWGIDGAAAATTITYIGVVLVKGAIFCRATGIAPRDVLLLRSGDIKELRSRVGRIVRRSTSTSNHTRAA